MRWDKDEISFLIDNYEKGDKKIIEGRLVRRNWNSIVLKANQLGLNREYKQSVNNLNKLLDDTNISYYWIGFLLADGYFNNGRVKLTLSNKDLKHLTKFQEFINVKSMFLGDKTCSVSVMDNNSFNEIIEKYKIPKRKTYNPIKFSEYKVSKELMLSLIIGFIDGDGSIRKVHNRKDCNLRFHLHKKWLGNLIFIEDFLYSYFSMEKNKTFSKIGNNGYSRLILSDNKLLVKLKSEVLKLDIPYMVRKWGVIDNEYIVRDELYKINYNKVISLHKKGVTPKKIMKTLSLKEGVVYKYIRDYKSLT